MEDRPLADLFPPATRARWLGLVDGVLKGSDFEKRLVSRTSEGLRIEPLYDKAAEPAPQPTRAGGPWRVAQRVDHPDPAQAAALALANLEGGADALSLVFAGAPAARGYGLAAKSVEDLDAALDGVMLPLIALRLDAGGAAPEAVALLRALAKRRGDTLAALDLDLGIDPIGLARAAVDNLLAGSVVAGGSTIRVSRVALIRPPMTTVASGRWISAPVSVAMAMGTKPSEATSAVIATGRNRVMAPSRMASRFGRPSATSCLMKVSMTRPLRTATPESAMNPTAAGTETGMPRSQSAKMPPVRASGTALNTSSASRGEPRAEYSNRKIRKKQTGTTTISRRLAEARFSNCPPQVT